MTVVNLDDFRAPPTKIGPCAVTFMGFAYTTPERHDARMNVTVNIETDEDPTTIVSAVREQGGIYLPSQDGGKSFWFLPWPCAAVRISLVE